MTQEEQERIERLKSRPQQSYNPVGRTFGNFRRGTEAMSKFDPVEAVKETVKGITDMVGLTNHKATEDFIAETKAVQETMRKNSEESLRMARQSIDENKARYKDWEEAFGSARASLKEYYDRLDPTQVENEALRRNVDDFQRTTREVDDMLASRGMSYSGLSANIHSDNTLQLYARQAEAVANSEAFVQNQRQQYMGMGYSTLPAYVNPINNAYMNYNNAQAGYNNSLANQATMNAQVYQAQQAQSAGMRQLLGMGLGMGSYFFNGSSPANAPSPVPLSTYNTPQGISPWINQLNSQNPYGIPNKGSNGVGGTYNTPQGISPWINQLDSQNKGR